MSLDRHMLIERAYKQFETGQFSLAEQKCAELLARDKDDIQAIRLRGLIAYSTGRYDEAATLLKKCINRYPKEATYHYDLARVWAVVGRFDDAVARFDKAIQLKPDYSEAIAGKADALERGGKREAAKNYLAPMMDKGTNDDGLAVVMMRLLEHEGRLDESVAMAERLLAVPQRDLVARRMLNLQVGRAYDRLGKYELAYAAYLRANASGPVRFDPEHDVESVDRLIETYSAENLRALPRGSDRSEVPVFIACMPRSGSTLVEQIIHAHPHAFGAGEINDIQVQVETLQEQIVSFQPYPACIADLKQSQIDEFAGAYLKRLAKLGQGASRVTNKNLLSYRHLGYINLLFPGARIVHIRRHRVDNCLACLMAALDPGQFPWVADPQYAALVWRQYERLMAHWREVLDIPMLEVKYEELVEHTEREIRRIIDFCGLPWDDKCLRYWEVDRKVLTLSYDQVRQPIFKTAVMRYKRYEKFLGPLIEALGEEIE